MGHNIDQHHIADNMAKVEWHMDLNKILIQHLDKLDKAVMHNLVDNIVAVAFVADIAVDNQDSGLPRLDLDNPYALPSQYATPYYDTDQYYVPPTDYYNIERNQNSPASNKY